MSNLTHKLTIEDLRRCYLDITMYSFLELAKYSIVQEKLDKFTHTGKLCYLYKCQSNIY